MILKAFLVGLLIAFFEVLNGNLRVRVLYKIFGKEQAKQISLVLGMIIIFIICRLTLSWIAPSTYLESLLVGVIWFVMMLFLDIYFGRYVFKFSWTQIADDFDLRKGNLITLGMLFLFFCPLVVYLFF